MTNDNKPKIFILDVDGVMTTGHFIYSEAGKQMKIFGIHNFPAIAILVVFYRNVGSIEVSKINKLILNRSHVEIGGARPNALTMRNAFN